MISLGWYDLIIVIKFLSRFWYLAFLGLASFCPAHIFPTVFPHCFARPGTSRSLLGMMDAYYWPVWRNCCSNLLQRCWCGEGHFFALWWQLHCSISNLGFCRPWEVSVPIYVSSKRLKIGWLSSDAIPCRSSKAVGTSSTGRNAVAGSIRISSQKLRSLL